MKNLVEQINKFENGEMEQEEVIEFFQYLIDTGYIAHLQGFYQRTAMDLLREGLVTMKGVVLQ